MNISQTLKQARKAAGLTQSQLAEKVGISYGAIVNYENGRRTNISADILFAIADALNVFPNDLLNNSENENSNDAESRRYHPIAPFAYTNLSGMTRNYQGRVERHHEKKLKAEERKVNHE